jgi:hypothetical protein
VIYGDLGVSPGMSVTGFPPGMVTGGGITHINDAVAVEAPAALVAATPLLRRSRCHGRRSRATSVGRRSVRGCTRQEHAGDHRTLTLAAGGDPGATFVLSASTLNSAAASQVVLQGGAQRAMCTGRSGPP